MLWGLLFCWGLAAQDLPNPPKQTPAIPNPKPPTKQSTSPPKKLAPDAQVDSGANSPDQQQDLTPVPQARDQLFPVDQPHFSDPLQYLWYGIMGISGLSILALGYTAWRLKFSGAPPTVDLDTLEEQVNSVRNQAVRAKARYEELATRSSRQSAPQPPQFQAPPFVPPREPQEQRPQPPYIRDPYGREPEEARPPRFGPPPKVVLRSGAPRADSPPDISPPVAPRQAAPPPRDDLVDTYHQARTDRGARDQFDNRYQYVRISCTNHEEWQYHKNTTLRFEGSDYGWYLMVNRGGKALAFPWFTQDLDIERESFKGVFQYPEGGGDAKLRVVRPAVLQSQGDAWILTEPGEVRADA
jgi:hypothetical protein